MRALLVTVALAGHAAWAQDPAEAPALSSGALASAAARATSGATPEAGTTGRAPANPAARERPDGPSGEAPETTETAEAEAARVSPASPAADETPDGPSGEALETTEAEAAGGAPGSPTAGATPGSAPSTPGDAGAPRDAPKATTGSASTAPVGAVAEAERPGAFQRWLDDVLWGARRWEDGRARLFVAGQFDGGYVYVRARNWFGYGRPHDVWGGLEVTALLGQGGVGAFAGLAGGLRFVQFRVGARGFQALERDFLAAAERHERVEFQRGEALARYLVLEGELTAEVPLGPGELRGLASLSAVQGVPAGQHVYEETLRVVVKPPWVWRARAEYAFFLVKGARHDVGVVAEVFGVPARQLVQVRAGVVARAVLSPSLELRLSLIPTVYSQDSLGLVTSDFTELGLRYRFATGR